MIALYRPQRLQQPIVRSGKIVTKHGKTAQVSFVTVNRELSFLRFLLNLAVDEEILEESPRSTSKRKNASLIKSEKESKARPRCVDCRVPRFVEEYEKAIAAGIDRAFLNSPAIK